MSGIREEQATRHRRKRGFHLGDFGGSEATLPDAHFSAQASAPLHVLRGHVFAVEIKASFLAQEVRQVTLTDNIAPSRHRIFQQASERGPIATRAGRQRLPNKTRQPRSKCRQGCRPNCERAFGVEKEAWQIAQNIGIADRRAGVGSKYSGIAVRGPRTGLVGVDDNDLPASRRQSKRRRKPDDSGSDNSDVSLDGRDHGPSDHAGDFEMTGVQEFGHDRERMPQFRQRGRGAHIDAHRMS